MQLHDSQCSITSLRNVSSTLLNVVLKANGSPALYKQCVFVSSSLILNSVEFLRHAGKPERVENKCNESFCFCVELMNI